MLLEQRSVSRKTPLDGMLEISAAAAARISERGPRIQLRSAGHEGSARLRTLECDCAKGVAGRHTHHFLESPLLRTLAPGSEVRVELHDSDDGDALLRIEAA